MAAFRLDPAFSLRLLCLIAIVSTHIRISSSIDPQGLFGTLTTYTNARRYLKKLEDPHSPFDSVLLKEKHRQLRMQGCRPALLYMVGRHAARFPDKEEIKLFGKHLPQLVDFILKYSKQKPSEQFHHWTFQMAKSQNNLMTFIGANEQQDLAKRLKKLYPEFFDVNRSQVELASTSKFRTVQSAVEFAKEIKGFHIHDSCHPSQLPTSDTSSPAYDVNSVLYAPCYSIATEKLQKVELEYHKVCKKEIMKLVEDGVMKIAPKVKKAKGVNQDQVARLKEELFYELAQKVRSKLSLRSAPPAKLIESAFNLCAYETATKSDGTTSVWCELFEADDLAALEYLEDAKLFRKTAKGLSSNIIQSCPLVKDILGKITGFQGREAHFGFTHVGVLKKLLSTLGFFGDESDERANELAGQGYSDADLDRFERTRKLPGGRSWRSSVMMPFSANVGFVLYKCAAGSSRQEADWKVLTSISERPVRVRGCSDSACPLTEFLDTYKGMLGCDIGLVQEEVAKNLGATYVSSS